MYTLDVYESIAYHQHPVVHFEYIQQMMDILSLVSYDTMIIVVGYRRQKGLMGFLPVIILYAFSVL